MAFDPQQLDEIRSRLKVSEVVGRRFKLRKQGSEYVAIEDQSLTVNDNKGLWYDFGKGDGGGDIFDFLQQHEGYDFIAAVEELAQQAGVILKDASGPRKSASPRKPKEANGGDRGGDVDTPRNDGPPPQQGKREVVQEWDYRDAENNLLYQVVRMHERYPDGSLRKTREGKTWKTFMQRRPAGDGSWILGLDVIDRDTDEPYQFVKTAKSTAWLRANEERLQWNNITVRTFAELGNVDHWLYNANAVLDELQEPKEDQRTIFLPEGEGKVDVLKEWGLLGVTNSGGAKHFTADCAAFFAGARHVVILQDNDRAGSERVEKIAPLLLAAGVELVQALNFRDIWPACPMKGDVKDWRDVGGGTKEQLLDVVDNLKPWTPAPYQSKFGAKTAADLGGAVRAYPWRIKGILPMNDNVLLMGPSRSGKTFECLDMVMHVHNGQPFAGRKVVPGGYVYLTYEGATGFENRLRAYLRHNDMKAEDLHSFAWLTRPPNMYASEDNAKNLADEVLKIAERFRLPLAGTIIDTHNAATRGSSEIKSEDMNKILNNYEILRDKTQAPLIVIGHTNAEGKHRGNEQFFNNIETALLIERVTVDKHGTEKRDDEGRVIRRGRVQKQREGDDRTSWEFVLQPVKIGTDEDGDDIISMVSVEPSQNVPHEVLEEYQRGGVKKPEGFYLKGHTLGVFKSLLRAIDNIGKAPPPELGLPPGITRVINWSQLGLEYQKTDPRETDESIEKYRNRIKARTRRFREELLPYNVIGIASMKDPSQDQEDIDKPRMVHYVWPTGRKVFGRGLQWPPQPPKKKEAPQPLLAPGESPDDLPPDVF